MAIFHTRPRKGLVCLVLVFHFAYALVVSYLVMDHCVRPCEQQALISMRKIMTAQAKYVELSKSQSYAMNFSQLIDMGLLPEKFRDGYDSGYRYKIRLDVSEPAYSYQAKAVPVWHWYSQRCFYGDQSGVMRSRSASSWSNVEECVIFRSQHRESLISSVSFDF